MSTKSIWNSTQKIGIELEVYADGGTNRVHEFVNNKGMEGLHVCGDGSLGYSGAEIKFAQGTPLNKAKAQIESMYKLATDTTTLNTKFRTVGSNRYLPSDAKVPRYEGYGGTTGLHIHFNAGEGYNPMDVLRLAKKLASKPADVSSLAWRSSRAWGCSARTHTIQIGRQLRNIVGTSPEDLESIPLYNSRKSIRMNTNKYIGMNICNLLRDRKTIEFRFGDAALMTDPSAFEKYLTYLKEAWDECFTGEDTMQWNNTCFLKWNGSDTNYHETSGWHTVYGREIDVHEYKRGRIMGDKITTALLNI